MPLNIVNVQARKNKGRGKSVISVVLPKRLADNLHLNTVKIDDADPLLNKL